MPPPTAPAKTSIKEIDGAAVEIGHSSETVKIDSPLGPPYIFTPRQARALGQSLMRAARDAEDLQRQAKRGATYQARHPVQLETGNSKLETPPDMSPDEELSHDANGKA